MRALPLAAFLRGYSDPIEHERGIWKLMTFLGRYAHQPIKDMLAMRVRDLAVMMRCTGEFIELEASRA